MLRTLSTLPTHTYSVIMPLGYLYLNSNRVIPLSSGSSDRKLPVAYRQTVYCRSVKMRGMLQKMSAMKERRNVTCKRGRRKNNSDQREIRKATIKYNRYNDVEANTRYRK